MLEQPPERTISEVEAEVAAQSQNLRKRKVSGYFRVLIHAIPSFVFLILFIGFIVLQLSYGGSVYSLLTPYSWLIFEFTLLLAITYGSGLFDAQFSHEVRFSPAEQRSRKVLKHALIFTLYQLIIIPCGLAAFFGILIAVCSLVSNIG